MWPYGPKADIDIPHIFILKCWAAGATLDSSGELYDRLNVLMFGCFGVAGYSSHPAYELLELST
jgi:hypothetical protein